MTTVDSSATAQRRGERMREATDRKIMQATLQIVTSKGVGAVTIEEVARRSGVAKTTIYRRYKNADDLLRGIQLAVAHTPDHGSCDMPEATEENLRTLLEQVVASFDDGIGLKAVGIVLSSDNEYLRGMAEQVIAPAEHRFAEFISHGESSGTVRHGLDSKFLFSTILGSMLACKVICNEAGKAWADHITRLLWPTVAA